MIEKVYINGGEVYKENKINTLHSTYTYNPEGDGLFPFSKNTGKKYFFTSDYKEYFPMDANNTGISLDNYDLCPDIDLWICLGAPTIDETSNYDLFFAIQSLDELHSAAEYYNLPYPITSEIENLIVNYPNTIHFWRADNLWVVPAGIKFENGVPTLLKVYTYPTDIDGWKTWMLGKSWYNQGTLYESGGIYHQFTGGHGKDGYILRGQGSFEKAESIVSEIGDDTVINYTFTKTSEGGDPIIMWQGNETTNGVTRIKKYQSTNMMRMLIGNLNTGDNLEEYDLCPDVNWWLGKSYYDDSDEVELYFFAESTSMLDSVASYYNLQVPYDDRLANAIDNDPESLRVRHYDLNNQGEGNYVPVVVGSVVIEDSAVMLKLYEFTRES